LNASALRDKWHKYTAFNIVPMGPSPDNHGFGTVEFRHLYGTDNIEVFQTWLSAIKELYLYIATKPEFSLLKTLANIDVAELVQEAIPTLARRHTAEEIKSLCADSLIDVKLSNGGIK
jgi:hypothetical protein